MIYSIASARLVGSDGSEILSGSCYAGGDVGSVPEAVNNPDFCSRQFVGPLPPGKYKVGPLMQHQYLGPAMALAPDPENKMYGRGDFYFHYVNPARDAGLPPYPPTPGNNSSDGCIAIRTPGMLDAIEKVRLAGDDELIVTT